MKTFKDFLQENDNSNDSIKSQKTKMYYGKWKEVKRAEYETTDEDNKKLSLAFHSVTEYKVVKRMRSPEKTRTHVFITLYKQGESYTRNIDMSPTIIGDPSEAKTRTKIDKAQSLAIDIAKNVFGIDLPKHNFKS